MQINSTEHAAQLLRNKLESRSVHGMLSMFRHLSHERKLKIGFEEFKDSLKVSNVRISSRDAQKLFDAFRKRNSDTITFESFARVMGMDSNAVTLNLANVTDQTLRKKLDSAIQKSGTKPEQVKREKMNQRDQYITQLER